MAVIIFSAAVIFINSRNYRISRRHLIMLAIFFLHLLLVYATLIISKFMGKKTKFACNANAYLSHYGLVACFSWLCLMIHDVYINVNQKEFGVAETTVERRGKYDVKVMMKYAYDCSAFLGSVIICIITIWSTASFNFCFRVFLNSGIDHAYLPIILIMTYGVILIVHTTIRFFKASKSVNRKSSCAQESFHRELRRFGVLYKLIN